MEFRAADIAAAVGGTLSGSDVDVDGAGFDSRLIRPGQLFVPVRGERDGHDYIDAAREGGAVATFSSRGAIDGLATIEVADVDGERRATCDVWLDREGEHVVTGTAVVAIAPSAP